MKNLKNLVKGGMETIIVVVLLIAIVIALFVAVILPNFRSASNLGSATTGTINDLSGEINDVLTNEVENWEG